MTSKEWQWVKRVNISIKGLLQNKLGLVVNMRSRDVVNIDEDVCWNGFFFRRLHAPLVSPSQSNILCLVQFTSQPRMANSAKVARSGGILPKQWTLHRSQSSLQHILDCILLESAKLNKLANKLWSNYLDGRRFTDHMIMKFVITRPLFWYLWMKQPHKRRKSFKRLLRAINSTTRF